MPKVSFVVAVYNVADYVERCMRSLCEQTLDDIEVVVVDDCTPDDSVAVIERTLADYPRRKGQFRFVRHDRNRGIAQTRWDGAQAATGEYLLQMDGDDYVEPQMAELMYGKARETDADMVLCDVYWQRENGKVWRVRGAREGMDSDAIREAVLNRQSPSNVWCKLFRRRLLTDNALVWPPEGCAEDCVISSVLAYYAGRAAYLPEPLYHYVYRAGSIIRNRSEENILKNLNGQRANNQVLMDFLEQKGVLERYHQGVFIDKVRCRNFLLPLTGKRKYRRLFRNTYPEVSRSFLWGDRYRRPTYRERIWICAVLLGLYPRCRRALESKYLRLREGWK